MTWIFTWWAWFAGALVLAILETLAPIFVFLGLAAGAFAVGILVALGITFDQSAAMLLVIFAVVSLIVTLVLRQMMGPRGDEVKTFTDDINS